MEQRKLTLALIICGLTQRKKDVQHRRIPDVGNTRLVFIQHGLLRLTTAGGYFLDKQFLDHIQETVISLLNVMEQEKL